MLIPDRRTDGNHLFEDDEIAAFLSLEGGDVRRATALALETAASNEALVSKVIWLMDLKTDGAKVSDALLKRAAQLREQAEDADDDASGVDYAEWAVDAGARRDI